MRRLVSVDSVSLGAEAAGGGAVLEVTAKGGGEERAEDDLGAPVDM